MRASTKVSKKVKLSKSKVNYRKHERKAIAKLNRRQGKRVIARRGVSDE